MRCVTKTGARLAVQLSTVNGTELGVQEWRYALLLQYSIDPLEPPKFYGGCNLAFYICHALNCKNSDLVTAHHNELFDGFA